MAGRNTRHLGEGGRHKRRPGGRDRLEPDQSGRLGIGSCARIENVFRHYSLRTAPPRFQHRPGFRNPQQGQISGPDRNRHQNPRRAGIRSGSSQGTGRNAYTHPPLLRLCDGGRDEAGGQDLQLGIRPEELQRSGRQLLHRSGQPRDTHPRVQGDGEKPASERDARRPRRGLQPHGLGRPFELQPYRPRLLLPPECRRFLLGRLGLRQ